MNDKVLTQNKNRDLKLLKAKDVAEVLNVSRSMAYRLMQYGNIPTVHLGKAIRVRPEDLDAYIRKNLYGEL